MQCAQLLQLWSCGLKWNQCNARKEKKKMILCYASKLYIFLAYSYINFYLQVIGVVVADTHENAKLAARKVHVEYEELPAILSIQDAINAESFYPDSEKCFRKGDADHCFQSGQCDKIIEGEVQIGGQEHFYLEPHSSVIWTVDGGNEVHMISSTQVRYTFL